MITSTPEAWSFETRGETPKSSRIQILRSADEKQLGGKIGQVHLEAKNFSQIAE